MNGSKLSNPRVVRLVALYHPTDAPCAEALGRQLAPLVRTEKIEYWHQGLLQAGENREQVIRARIAAANMLLLLVSAEFNESYARRFEQHLSPSLGDKAHIIPIVARYCLFSGMPFSHLQFCPRNRQPLILEGKQVSAERCMQVVEELEPIIEGIADRPGTKAVTRFGSEGTFDPEGTAAFAGLLEEVAAAENHPHLPSTFSDGAHLLDAGTVQSGLAAPPRPPAAVDKHTPSQVVDERKPAPEVGLHSGAKNEPPDAKLTIQTPSAVVGPAQAGTSQTRDEPSISGVRIDMPNKAHRRRHGVAPADHAVPRQAIDRLRTSIIAFLGREPSLSRPTDVVSRAAVILEALSKRRTAQDRYALIIIALLVVLTVAIIVLVAIQLRVSTISSPQGQLTP